MNFLAHIYLSGDNELVRIGNFMADGIRGKQYEQFHDDVKKGIMLHRSIDTYTDSHPLFRQTTKRLHAVYHHYAGVIADVFYDHFLAANWHLYSAEPLKSFTENFYGSLHRNYELLTEKTKGMLPYMEKNNWLLSYRTVEGIGNILSQMDRRTGHISGMGNSVAELKIHYGLIAEEFSEFFEEIRNHSAQKLLHL